MPVTPKRIVIVDDHPIVRQGVAAVLHRQAGLTVIGEASDVESGYNLIRATKPDIAIIDISLPGVSGLELIDHLAEVVPEVAILVMSMLHEDDYAERVRASGARGYLMKQEVSEKIVSAVEAILSGGKYFPARKSLSSGERRQGVDSKKDKITELSNLELEVLKLLGQGLSTKSIAELIHKSPKSVELYRSNLRSKLGLATANELIIFAGRWHSTEIG